MTPRAVPLALALATVLATSPALAQALDPETTGALDQTLRVLQDQARQGGPIPGVPASTELNRTVQGSPELTRELYDVAGQVLREITQSAGGDAGKMGQVVDRGKSDPARFMESLSPATRERIETLARKIEGQHEQP
jgi:hypothetical protein